MYLDVHMCIETSGNYTHRILYVTYVYMPVQMRAPNIEVILI